MAILVRIFKYLVGNPLIGVLVVSGLLNAGQGAKLWYQSLKLDAAQSKLVATQTKYDGLQQDYQVTLGRVDESNQAVLSLKRQAAVQQDQLNQAQAQAREVRIIYKDRARKIQQVDVGESCPDALQWGIEQAKKLSEDWYREP